MISRLWLYLHIETKSKKYCIKAATIDAKAAINYIPTVTVDSSHLEDFEMPREGAASLDQVETWQTAFISDERVYF